MYLNAFVSNLLKEVREMLSRFIYTYSHIINIIIYCVTCYIYWYLLLLYLSKVGAENKAKTKQNLNGSDAGL
jgi:hypothetical protein